MTRSTAALALLWLPLQPVLSQQYQLIQNYNSSNFFDEFRFFSGPDPTGGFVDYLPFDTATSRGLVRNATGQVYLGVDSTNAYAPGGSRRPSVRVESKMTFTEGLFVVDLTHMPVGCGTWPAFWTAGLGDWPADGEIDIIENVNDARTNNVALHATGNCTVLASTIQRGTVVNPDCTVGHDDNQGCATALTEPHNYGAGFNANGGGVYAMEWNSSAINVWFFGHGKAPKALMHEGLVLDPATFGTPSATFAGPCSGSFPDKFFNHSIIIDTTFCGGWAGGTFGTGFSSCPIKPGTSSVSSCIDYVAKNPGAFKDAWWGIRSLKVWAKVPGFTTEDSNLASTKTNVQETVGPFIVSPLAGGVLSLGRGDIVSKQTTTKKVFTSTRRSSTRKAGPTPANAAPLNVNVLPLVLPLTSSRVVSPNPRPWFPSTTAVNTEPTPKPWYVDLPGPINEDGLPDDSPVDPLFNVLVKPATEALSPSINPTNSLDPSAENVDFTLPEATEQNLNLPKWHDWESGSFLPVSPGESTNSDYNDDGTPIGSESYNPIMVEDYFPGQGPKVPGSSKPLDWAMYDSSSNLIDSGHTNQSPQPITEDILSEDRVPGRDLPLNPLDWTPGPVLPDVNNIVSGI